MTTDNTKLRESFEKYAKGWSDANYPISREDAYKAGWIDRDTELQAKIAALNGALDSSLQTNIAMGKKLKSMDALLEEMAGALASVYCDMYDSKPLDECVCKEVEQALTKYEEQKGK